jgi:hypothetical protein
MKYILGAIGLGLLFYLLTMEKVTFLGATCHIVGSQKINPKAGGLFGQLEEPTCLSNTIYSGGILIGILLVATAAIWVFRSEILIANAEAPHAPGSFDREQRVVATHSFPPPTSTENYNIEKWNALKEIDEDIAKAVISVKEHGPNLEEELAKRYLAISEKSYLPKIVELVISKSQSPVQNLDSQSVITNTPMDTELLSSYENIVRENYGRDPNLHKFVKSIEHYHGSSKEFFGGIMVTVEGESYY